MNSFYTEYEMLSAYIDGELNQEEVKYIEGKIAVSKDLQLKLAELKRLKELSQSSFQKAADSPYFETKVLARITSENTSRFRFEKWIPVAGVTVATIVLMLFLKANPYFFDSIIEEQKSKLSGLYTENLKPLFVTAGLTNEDIFNFALYRKLPLDKERGQYLQLGANADGSEFFEIKAASLKEDKNEFENFISALELNQKQKKQIDSILESYAEDIQTQVLVNENKTVAISPKLWNYNKAIFADIMAFAKDANREQFVKIVPAEYSKLERPKLMEIAHVVKNAADSDYIFVTPDTIFIEQFTFDKERFAEDIKKIQVDIKKNLREAERELKEKDIVLRLNDNIIKLQTKGGVDKNFEIFIDTNVCRVRVPNFNINLSDMHLPNLEVIEEQIAAATRNLESFAIRIPDDVQVKKNFKFKYERGDSSGKFKYDISVPFTPEAFFKDSLLFNNAIFKFKADSLSREWRLMFDDSIIFNQKDFKMQMKEFQKEMRKLREEMLRLQNDLQKEPKKVQTKESIEI